MRVGEKQKAFEWLDKAYEEHDSGLVSVAVEPMFEPIRTDPRFKVFGSPIVLPSISPHPQAYPRLRTQVYVLGE